MQPVLGRCLGLRTHSGPVAVCKLQQQTSSTFKRKAVEHSWGQITIASPRTTPTASLQHVKSALPKQPYSSHSGLGVPPARRKGSTVCHSVLLGYLPVSGHPNWDVICALAAAVAAYTWVKVFDKLATSGIIDQKLSRKLVHSTAGPLFVLVWPFFSEAPEARVFAAAVPCLNLIRLLAVGSGAVSDPGLVHSVSRGGDKSELLKGPLYYVLVMISMTIIFWRQHPAGLMAISMMCGGDGLADIVGRRFGSSKLPWNSNKSWAGSAAMFLGGMVMAGGLVWLFCSLGYYECLKVQYMLPYIAAVCLASTVVESLPINQWLDDNLSVPGVAVAVSCLALPYVAAASHGCAIDAHLLLPQSLKL